MDAQGYCYKNIVLRIDIQSENIGGYIGPLKPSFQHREAVSTNKQLLEEKRT